jgi:L-ascorbate metabolism protein UlaG (beta-lactamase superfamily)
MRLLSAIALVGVSIFGAGFAQKRDTFSASGAPVTIFPIGHGSLGLVYGETVVLIDPARFVPGQPEPTPADLQELARTYLSTAGSPPPPTPGSAPIPDLLVSALPIRPEQVARFANLPPPTVVLITHDHTDHLDPRVIAAIRTPATRIIVPTAAATMMLNVQGAETLGHGERKVIGDVEIEAIPMYNLRPDPQSGIVLHPRGRGNGYVLSLGGRRILAAGDTDCIPEVSALRNIDVAFVPMNPPYTMSPTEAAACVMAMSPTVVYPYHHFGADVTVFQRALQAADIEVRLRDWYTTAPAASN